MKSKLTSKNRWFLIGSLLFLYFYYFISSAGINCSNDGGHMALASAIYNDHQLSVEQYEGGLVLKPDYAIKNDIIYSDRLPGNAILIIPSLLYADIVKSIIPEKWVGSTSYNITATAFSENEHFKQSSNFDIKVATLLPNISGVLGLFLLFLICWKIFQFNFKLSIAVVLIAGLCTLNHLESTHLFSHAPSMLFITLATGITLHAKQSANFKINSYVMSAVIGFSTIIELQNVLFFFPLFFYIIVSTNQFEIKKYKETLKILVSCAFIICFFISWLILYNYLAFDELILKSNKFNPFFPEEKSFINSLSGNPFRGLDRLFTNFLNLSAYTNWSSNVSNGTPGLFASNPVFILSIIGFIPFFKKNRKESLLFLAMIIIAALIASFHVTTLVRHIFTIHMLLFLPIIYFFESLKSLSKPIRIISYVAIIALVSLSFFRQAFITNHYFRFNSFGEFPYLENLSVFFILNTPLFLLILYRVRIFKYLFTIKSQETLR